MEKVIANICTNIPDAVVLDKSFTHIFLCNVYYIGVTDEKSKLEKEGKNKSQHFGFLSRNIFGHSQGVYKI